jgi:DeoR/GlpR family transcriptional regulator of sugar metabolism
MATSLVKNAETRRTHLISLVMDKGFVSVQDLSDFLRVSKVTIRGDLSALEDAGAIKRQHGGATIPKDDLPGTIAFQARARINQLQKQKIGELAATLVQDGDSILIDSSTTGLYLARALKNKNDLKIVTNGINTSIELLKNSHTVIMVGGMLNDRTYGTVGRLGRNTLTEIRVAKAFLGAGGVSMKDGLTDTNLLEVELKQAVLEITSELIAVVDSSKFSSIGISSFAPILKVSAIVTDSGLSEEQSSKFEELGIKLHIA